MNRLLFSLCFFIFIPLNRICAQDIVVKVIMEKESEKKNEIVYQKGSLLKFSDFQGEVETGMNAIAMAYSGVALQYRGAIKKEQIQLEVRMYPSFDKSRSWCMLGHRNEYTLAHEQVHFYITVINACKLFRVLQTYSFTKNFEQEIIDLQRKYKELNEAEQDDYDLETNHGINKENQADWELKINKLLLDCNDCY